MADLSMQSLKIGYSILNFYRYLLALIVLLGTITLTSCNNGGSADAPTDVTLTAGDGVITVTWTMQPGVQYWLFYAPTNSITKENWNTFTGATVLTNVSSPYVVSGLANNTTYAFIMDGRYNGGAGGPSSASLPATPRLAGTSWILGTPPASADFHATTYGTMFVTVGTGGVIYSSADAKSWTPQNSGGITTSLLGVTYSSGQYLGVGAGGKVLTSPDAISWTPQVSGSSNDLNAVATNGAGLYVAVGTNGTILSSSGGSAWADHSSGSYTLNAVTYANSQFVAVGDNGTILTSPDGATWASPAMSAYTPTSMSLSGIAYGNASFVVTGDQGTLITNSDGTNWIVSGSAQFATTPMHAVIYATQFIAVGDGGSIYTSPDGMTWQSQTSGTANPLYAIAHGNHGYSVVGASGTNLTAY